MSFFFLIITRNAITISHVSVSLFLHNYRKRASFVFRVEGRFQADGVFKEKGRFFCFFSIFFSFTFPSFVIFFQIVFFFCVKRCSNNACSNFCYWSWRRCLVLIWERKTKTNFLKNWWFFLPSKGWFPGCF